MILGDKAIFVYYHVNMIIYRIIVSSIFLLDVFHSIHIGDIFALLRISWQLPRLSSIDFISNSASDLKSNHTHSCCRTRDKILYIMCNCWHWKFEFSLNSSTTVIAFYYQWITIRIFFLLKLVINFEDYFFWDILVLF